jgi:hypothetical protein
MATQRAPYQFRSNLDYARDTRNNPIGTTPYSPSNPAVQSGRSKLDPARIAEKVGRGTARPREIQASKMLNDQKMQDLKMPAMQLEATQAQMSSDILEKYRDQIMKNAEAQITQQQTGGTQTGGTQTGGTQTGGTQTGDSVLLGGKTETGVPVIDVPPVYPSASEDPANKKFTSGTIMDGGPMEESEDAYLMGEEGPEMAIKRDDGSLFVLPADVTKKIMAGISMEDTPENQDAMSAAMQRMGMEVSPKMCGGKMKTRMAGGKMKAYMKGGEMNPFTPKGAAAPYKSTKMATYMGGGAMAKEGGRMSRSSRRKNVLFDAMQKLA